MTPQEIEQYTEDPDSLTKLPVSRLREMHRSLNIKETMPFPKSLIIRDIAWHLQSKKYGGMTKETKKLLKAAMRQVSIYKDKEPENKPRPKAPNLTDGTILKRIWNNRVHEVLVSGQGKCFIYKDKKYKSLSKIAKVITGAHWSGPRFFGLNKLNKKHG